MQESWTIFVALTLLSLVTLSSSTMDSSQCVYDSLQAIIGTDAGNRGMKPLIVEKDLGLAAKTLARLPKGSHVIVLSGFPCCVNESPPTETDGPPGTFAIARAAASLGHEVTVVTDDCNAVVFEAARNGLSMPENSGEVTLETFPAVFSQDDERRFSKLADACNLIISCERAGPAKDGRCYTMRGIDMNEKGLIAPLHRFVKESTDCLLISIGDGGNELGMGKVLQKIVHNDKIQNGDKIGCVIPADFLIASSVSNWGGYALAAAAATAHVEEMENTDGDRTSLQKLWVSRCLPTEEDEISLLDRCVAAGCRDGVSGKMESTVDGMPLETSLKCLRDIRAAALSHKPKE